MYRPFEPVSIDIQCKDPVSPEAPRSPVRQRLEQRAVATSPMQERDLVRRLDRKLKLSQDRRRSLGDEQLARLQQHHEHVQEVSDRKQRQAFEKRERLTQSLEAAERARTRLLEERAAAASAHVKRAKSTAAIRRSSSGCTAAPPTAGQPSCSSQQSDRLVRCDGDELPSQ